MNTPDWLSTPQDVHVASQTLQALVTSELSKRVVSENEIKTIYLFLTRKCNFGMPPLLYRSRAQRQRHLIST